MQYLPGTTVEVRENSTARGFLDSAFSMGGLVLSQVTQLTGLEPHTVQNWVKRGFVSPPQQKKYDCNQFCRIIIINMFKDVFQIERIAALLDYAGGEEADDTAIYVSFSDAVAAVPGDAAGGPADLDMAVGEEVGKRPFAPRTRKRLEAAVRVMATAFISVRAGRGADLLLRQIEESY
jgi:DNA-binding transcriptional MerR regulator